MNTGVELEPLTSVGSQTLKKHKRSRLTYSMKMNDTFKNWHKTPKQNSMITNLDELNENSPESKNLQPKDPRNYKGMTLEQYLRAKSSSQSRTE